MQTATIAAFVTVCDLGSAHAAAVHLNISQPAISKRLTTLETRLGQRLFDRVGRRLALTEAGAAYLPHARELLAVLDDGQRTLDNLGNTVAGRLRLGLSHHVGLHRMPSVLRRFVSAHPAVEMDIAFTDSEAACRAVANGECELAVITLPQPPHPVLEQRAIWTDPMGIYTAPEHPLASRSVPDLATLDRYAALLPPVESTTYALIDAACRRFGMIPTPRMTSHYLETLRMLAGVGIGWTVLPLAMQHHGLQQITFPGLHISRTLGVVRHPRRSLSNAARALFNLLDTAAVSRSVDSNEKTAMPRTTGHGG